MRQQTRALENGHGLASYKYHKTRVTDQAADRWTIPVLWIDSTRHSLDF